MTHFSALVFDRLRLAELAAAEAGEVRAHLASCAACTGFYEELAVPVLLPRLRKPVSWKWTSAFAAVAAAAAIAVVVNPAASGERTKGGLSLGMFVHHGGSVRRALPGEVVAPFDELRFTATSVGAYVGVLSLDPRGVASIYAPMTRLSSGTDVALPVATRLDGSLGVENIFALFCSQPVELEPVRASLGSGRLAAPEGCQVVKWNFVKR